ncbi:MAG TPA: ABC transporter ATP-binding protein [Polyangiaceae bacterium LLY-WYZ-14_1]|nr:ABC transporter ATP-binding protein [Polyangiaceae bacterium LLY-WYZ-14_1]
MPATAADDASPFLDARGLTKSYGGRRVVDDLDVDCPRGSVLGLLGPNGAGKTTAIRLLYGLIPADAGSVRYGDRELARDRDAIRRIVGVTTQEDTLDYDFTVRQNLVVYAGYFKPVDPDLPARVDELLDRFGLREYADFTPYQLSGGYKRRLMIARSVVHRPDVLFLDEPTTGLDPKARVELWETIDGMRREGMTIVLTTHYMDEAERLSDRLLVMHRGRALATGTTGEVIGDLVGDRVLVVPGDEPHRAQVEAWARAEGQDPHLVLGELRVPIRSERLGEFTARFGDCDFTVRAPNLDDLFLTLAAEPPDGDSGNPLGPDPDAPSAPMSRESP